MIYKVSYVVERDGFPGLIANTEASPKVGDRVKVGANQYEVIELMELMPPTDDFYYVHATCKVING